MISLSEHNPDLTKEWNYDKTSIKPSEVSYGSNYKTWWIYSKCHNVWQAQVKDRTKQRRATGCPKCGKENVRGMEEFFEENGINPVTHCI